MGLAVEEVDVVEDMIRRGLLIGLNTSDKVRRSWLRRFLDTAFASAQFINRSYWSEVVILLLTSVYVWIFLV